MLNYSRLLINCKCNFCEQVLHKRDMAYVDADRQIITCSKSCYKKAIEQEKKMMRELYPRMFAA